MQLVKLKGDAERATKTTLDTLEITKKEAASWKSPPFQRELRPSCRVQNLSVEIGQTGVIPGVITLGILDGDMYIVDGQHRLHAFMISEAVVGYLDVRMHYFDSMGDMAKEYVALNTSLVRLRPDDILKGLEQSSTHLKAIRQKCNYVGYDRIRSSAKSPVLSMSTVLRSWSGSRNDVPQYPGGVVQCLGNLDDRETDLLIDWLRTCFEAWGRDPEYGTLWGTLNLVLVAWLYRRIVLAEQVKSTSRASRMDRPQFIRCLHALSANSGYMEYLVGRRISDRDRAPTYNRLKAIFAHRFEADKRQKLLMPNPAWDHTGG